MLGKVRVCSVASKAGDDAQLRASCRCRRQQSICQHHIQPILYANVYTVQVYSVGTLGYLETWSLKRSTLSAQYTSHIHA